MIAQRLETETEEAREQEVRNCEPMAPNETEDQDRQLIGLPALPLDEVRKDGYPPSLSCSLGINARKQ